jgi:nucleotide-binding universal stress UspA family protein
MKTRLELKLRTPSATARKPPRSDRRLRLTKLLVPVGFSAGANHALQYAADFARQFGASLTLLHVVTPICDIDFGYGSVVRHCQNRAVLENAKSRLSALGKGLAGLRTKPRTLVRTGTVESEIVAAARQLETDLIVMGTRGRWHSAETPRVGTAEKVLRCAPCPVLVIPTRNQLGLVSKN